MANPYKEIISTQIHWWASTWVPRVISQTFFARDLQEIVHKKRLLIHQS